MSEFNVDLVVIGAGSGGVRAARIAARHGARVLLAEEFRVGGTCVIRGCVPKKLLVYASRFDDLFSEASELGWPGFSSEFDWPTLVAGKNRVVTRLEGLYTQSQQAAGVEIVRSRAVIEDAHTVRRLRNRVIGRVFRELGYIEQWGSGIRRMTAACQAAGIDEPGLQEVGARFRVVLRRSSAPRRHALDETDHAIVTALACGDGLTTAEIASRIGRTPRATRTRLLALVGRGLVQEVASSLQDPKRRYFLTSGSR